MQWSQLFTGPEISPNESARAFFFPIELPPLEEISGEQTLLWAVRNEEKLPILKRTGSYLKWAFPLEPWLEKIRQLEGREPSQPIYTKLPGFDVNKVPAHLRSFVFKTLFKGGSSERRQPDFDKAFGIDKLLLALKELDVQSSLPSLRGFPDNKASGFVITLDVDSDYSFRTRSFEKILKLFEKHSLKAAWFFVTGRYPIPVDGIKVVQAFGHEIGWHGHRHDHKLAFLSPEARRRRLAEATPFLEKYDVVGMRTDNFLWSRPLFEDVATRIKYDTSFLECYPFVEDGRGPGTGKPFRMTSGLWQFPTTLTSEHFHPPKTSNHERLSLMARQMDEIIRLGGLVHLLLHPEPSISLHPKNWELLEMILRAVDERREALWQGTPRDLLRYLSSEGEASSESGQQVSPAQIQMRRTKVTSRTA